MRNLEECQAEVFRRSEKRIKERNRRRKHILMGCVPLALCVVLLCAAVLPDMLFADSQETGADGGVMGYVGENLISAVIRIDVTGGDISHSYTEAVKIRQIAERLNACAVKEPESAPAGPEDGNKENFSSGSGEYTYIGTTAPTAATGYIITLNVDGGATVVYRLAGSSLTDLTAKQTYPLTREQAEELRSLLGLK